MAQDTEAPGEDAEPVYPTSLNEVIEDLEELCLARGWDLGVKVDSGSHCAWGAEVRVTQQPNSHGTPDRSLVTFNTGGGDAEDALGPAVEDMLVWLASQRGHDEIQAAEEEYFDRLWYYRALAGNRSAEDLAIAADALRKVEAKHKNLITEGDFELGVIHGKLSALRWVLGDEWDNYDT